jgi:hypothetical protein
MSVCQFIHLYVHPHGTTQLPNNGFSLNLAFDDFEKKSVEKIQMALKSDKNNGYFTWKPMDIYDNTSLIFS